MTLPNPIAQPCTAHSSQTGLPCGMPAQPGQLVCRMHGGGSHQAIAAARQRMEEAADRAVTVLDNALGSENEAIRIRAATSILDRVGIGPTAKLEVHGELEIKDRDLSHLTDAEFEEYYALVEGLKRYLDLIDR